MKRYPTSVFPTIDQLLLLKAALFTGEEGLAAWSKWARSKEARIDGAAFAQILPLLFQNASSLQIARPNLDSVKAAFMRSHARHWAFTPLLKECLILFKGEGVPTILLKGAALARIYYDQLGHRPIGDVDILVPEHQFQNCLGLLLEMGWVVRGDYPISLLDPKFHSSRNLFNQQGLSLDLHAHVLHHSYKTGIDSPFWQDAVDLDTKEFKVRTLNPTDHLLHACFHGLQYKAIRPIQWIMDSYKILTQTGSNVDWDRLVRLASHFGIPMQLELALSYLSTEFHLPVPERVRKDLREARLPSFNRRFASLQMKPKQGRPMNTILFHWYRLRYLLYCNPGMPRFAGLKLYLRFWFTTTSVPLIALKVSVKSLRVILYRLGLYRYPV